MIVGIHSTSFSRLLFSALKLYLTTVECFTNCEFLSMLNTLSTFRFLINFSYLEYSAFPVISPHNRTFPYYFNKGRLTKTMVKRSLGGSNPAKQDVYLNISSPYAGNWFSAAFTDFQERKIKPEILKSNCTYFLTSSLNIWQINDTIVLYPNASTHSGEHSIFKIYKYMSTSTGPSLHFDVKFKQSSSSACKITALLRQSAFPDMNNFKNNDDHKVCHSNSTKNCSLSLDYPLENAWYYLGVTSECNYSIDVVISNNCVESPYSILNETLITFMESLFPGRLKQKTDEYCSKLFQPIETFRFIGPTYFSVKYYFNSNHNRSNALLIRNEKKPYFIEFLVDQANNGGTLNFYLVNNLINDPNLYESDFTVSKAPILPNEKNSTFVTKRKTSNLADIKVMLYACLLFNSMNNYKNCPEGFLLSTQSYTNIFSNFQLNVAYPFMGKWFLAIWKECFNINTKQSVFSVI
ncbi:transmembrane 8B isoform X2 [Brachionus plicatilis]|uniref:Transmembrane 8B isoform X2 n=1 Tax=Brachionus plicatilis TaxID=10195 RepID=A0A3M7RJ96_BRAPC|nr:transmembrane 8B isoform X2 [Brachionus plicatilis]